MCVIVIVTIVISVIILSAPEIVAITIILMTMFAVIKIVLGIFKMSNCNAKTVMRIFSFPITMAMFVTNFNAFNEHCNYNCNT